MSDANIECDAVTCCSLITALDKGGQWQLAEQVRVDDALNNECCLCMRGCVQQVREDDALIYEPQHEGLCAAARSKESSASRPHPAVDRAGREQER